MTRFFTILFIICALATAGIYYWKTQHPEGDYMADADTRVAPAGSSATSKSAGSEEAVTTSKELKKAARKALRQASKSQDLASLVSIGCSILSGLGAVVSAYFSYLRYRHQKRQAMRA